jgi:hypothetical protein
MNNVQATMTATCANVHQLAAHEPHLARDTVNLLRDTAHSFDVFIMKGF